MSQIINYESQRTTSVFTTLRFALLDLGSRVPTSYTITANTAATAVSLTTSASVTAAGATTITASGSVTIAPYSKIIFNNGVEARVDGTGVSAGTSIGLLFPLKSAIPASTAGTVPATVLTEGSQWIPVDPLPVSLFPGEKLIFDAGGANNGPITAIVSDYVPAGAIAVQTQPTTGGALTDADTASTYATIYFAGVTDASPSSAPKTVNTENFLSGAGAEMVTTGTNRTLSFTVQRVANDPGSDLLFRVLFDDALYNREVYAIVERDGGEKFEGAAIFTNGSVTSPVQDLVTVQADLQFQGSSFTYTPPTGSFNPDDRQAYRPSKLA
jgi:hypothetical protein